MREPGGDYTVIGDVVERTSSDAAGSAVHRMPVRLTMARVDDRWRIVNYEEERSSGAPGAVSSQGSAAAANVVRAYHRAIDEGL